MFRFEHTDALFWLWVVPALVFSYYLFVSLSKKQMAQLGSMRLIKRLTPGYNIGRQHLKSVALILALASLLVANANPQWGTKKEKVMAKSSDVFIAMDISQSMMSEDISPNRLERSKRLTQNIVRALRGNRIGLILFAGNAYLQMPLSSDYSAAQLFVSSANTSQASTQGTAIGEAIDLALRAYEPEKAFQRALIIITDGENHDDEAITKAREANDNGLSIFTIGVGTSEGGFVPFINQGREQFKRDESGNPIRSKLNVDLIRDLADIGGGKSYMIGQGNEIIPSLKNEILLLEKEEVEQRAFTDYSSYFQYFLVIGIILLSLEFIMPERISIQKPMS